MVLLSRLGVIIFQSTLPVGGATGVSRKGFSVSVISIHAPRGGSDTLLVIFVLFVLAFQSTLPVGGATNVEYNPKNPTVNFNPRSPWGERLPDANKYVTYATISIHAPRGGSDIGGEGKCHEPRISIHAPRGGSDVCRAGLCGAGGDFNPRSPWGERPAELGLDGYHVGFQSTLPVGGATRLLFACFCFHLISIHAPRGGSDHK